MLFKNSLASLKNGFIDALYPKFCLHCGREGGWMCSECLSIIGRFPSDSCPICSRESSDFKLCSVCKKSHIISKLIVRSRYSETGIKNLVQELKYQGNRELTDILGKLLENILPPEISGQKFILVPVPLHKKRRKERGFNQSDLISEILSNRCGIKEAKDLLIRVKETVPQAKLSRKSRLNACKGIFRLNVNSVNYQKATFIIVDDVFTTGGTMQACAEELSRLKPGGIWGLVLAHD